MKRTPKVKISRITIGRLFNLGNYEHIRYEIAAEIPPTTSAARIVNTIQNVLARLSPKCPIDLDRLQEREYEVAEAEKLTPAQIAKRYPKEEDQQRFKERLAVTKKDIVRSHRVYERWDRRQKKLLKLLDDLGAVHEFKDAKENWQSDDEY